MLKKRIICIARVRWLRGAAGRDGVKGGGGGGGGGGPPGRTSIDGDVVIRATAFDDVAGAFRLRPLLFNFFICMLICD